MPLLRPAQGSCFYVVSPKRIYWRHLNKRVMRASIVKMLGLNFATHVKSRTFATAMSRSRKLFYAASPKRIYWRHLNKSFPKGLQYLQNLFWKFMTLNFLENIDFHCCFFFDKDWALFMFFATSVWEIHMQHFCSETIKI